MEGNCKNCGIGITITEGRRPREFCTPNCRNKFYYKVSRIGVAPKPKGRPLKVVMNDGSLANMSDDLKKDLERGKVDLSEKKIDLSEKKVDLSGFKGEKTNDATLSEMEKLFQAQFKK